MFGLVTRGATIVNYAMCLEHHKAHARAINALQEYLYTWEHRGVSTPLSIEGAFAARLVENLAPKATCSSTNPINQIAGHNRLQEFTLYSLGKVILKMIMGSTISPSRITTFKNPRKRGVTIFAFGYICGEAIPLVGMSLITFMYGFLGLLFVSIF